MKKQNKKTIKKQNKKTLQTVAKKTVKKETAPAEEKKAVDFKTMMHSNPEDIKTALRLTREQRKAYLKSIMANYGEELRAIAERLGVGTVSELNPLKGDYTKIETIKGNNKGIVQSPTARMVYGLILCYLNRETDKSFARIFPTGLYLDKGLLNRLYNAEMIKSNSGEQEKQTFLFTDKCNYILKDSALLKLEQKMIDAEAL